MSVQTFEVDEDEEGMRLYCWFKRRMPMLSLSSPKGLLSTRRSRS